MSGPIRPANHHDHEALNQLFAELDGIHAHHLPEVFRKPDGPARSEEFLSRIINGEDSAVFIAEVAGQGVGFVHVLVREAPAIPIVKPRRFGVIDALYVREAARRSGIGRALTLAACEWASSKGATGVELNVWEFNQDAIAFYGRLGFSVTSRKMEVDLGRFRRPRT